MVTVQSVREVQKPGQMALVKGSGKVGDRVTYTRKTGERIVASIE